MVIQRIAQRIHPGPHRPGAAERIDEHRTLPFRFLVLELIDVHQEGLAVPDDELDRGPVGLGHDLRRLRLRAGLEGPRRQERRTDDQWHLHGLIRDLEL